MDITLSYEDENEEIYIEITVPAKYEVCSNCDGHGTHLNESMRHHAYTLEDDEFEDEGFMREYKKRGGIYDVTCQTCKGTRVVSVPDESKMSASQVKEYKEYKKLQDARDEEDAEFEAMCAAERRMGA